MSDAKSFNPILVTGASGFIGACLVRALLDQGYQVHVLLRSESVPWRLAAVWDRLQVHRGDLLDDQTTRALVHAVQPGAIFHLATHGAYEKQADARMILRTNILGTYNLLEAASHAKVRLLVNTGSSSEYGFKSQPMTESDCLEPNSYYSVAKAAQTHLCSLLARWGQVRTVTLRLFSVYGPWEEPTRLMPTLLQRAGQGLPLNMTAPDVVRDFVYIDDVVDALLDLPRLAEHAGAVINLGTGIETTLRDVVQIVKEQLDSTSTVHWGAMPARHWDHHCWAADSTKARQLLGWAPRFSLREGLQAFATWMEQRGNAYGDGQHSDAA